MIHFARLFEGHLGLRIRHLVDDFLQGDSFNLAALTVHLDLNVLNRPVAFLCRGHQRGLHRIEYTPGVNPLFASNLFDHCEEFATHHCS